jgi:hypothetical protein
MLLEKLFADCFEYLRIEVSYCNHKREEISKIKALIKCPDTTYSIGNDRTLTQQIASIEVRSQDITCPSVGDHIKIGGKFYKIFEPPLRDSSGMLLKVECIAIGGTDV